MIFSKQNLKIRDKTSFHQFLNMASSGLKKMLISLFSNTGGVTVLVCPAIFGHFMGFCNSGFVTFSSFLALLFWIGSCSLPYFWQMLLPCIWQMLLPCFDVVDVTTTRQMLCLFGSLADVLANFSLSLWQMLLPYVYMADVIAIWCILL